jgi:Zn finger protein HypA/HybF involved in hydrogenase expression
MNIPHRRNDALESAEKHCRRQMHRLVGLVLVSLGRLTGTQESQKSAIELQLRELRDRQSTITKAESALRRIGMVLNAVTCEMDNVRFVYEGRCTGHSRIPYVSMYVSNLTLICHSCDEVDFLIHSGYGFEIPL